MMGYNTTAIVSYKSINRATIVYKSSYVFYLEQKDGFVELIMLKVHAIFLLLPLGKLAQPV
jgi:hypothetical protein